VRHYASTRTVTPIAATTKIGFVLAIIAALPNLIVIPTPDGEAGPPLGVTIGGAVIAVLTIIAVIVAWRTGRRWATLAAVAGTLILALGAIPALLVDGVPVGWQVASAVMGILAIAAIVLMLYPASRSSEARIADPA
jgi:MFS family permease